MVGTGREDFLRTPVAVGRNIMPANSGHWPVWTNDSRNASQKAFNRYGSHEQNCLCERCVENFRSHNRDRMCRCYDCDHTRVIMPALTTAVEKYAASSNYGKTPYGPQREGELVSTVNFCERKGCTALAKGDAISVLTVTNVTIKDQPGQYRRVELCPACTADVMAVLKVEPLTPREKSYSEPYNDTPEHDAVESASAEQLAAALFQKLMSEQSRKAIESE